MRSKPTSIDIMHERDALRVRVQDLDEALGQIAGEIEHALRHPELHFLALCRIASLVRGTRACSPPISSTRPVGEEASRRAG